MSKIRNNFHSTSFIVLAIFLVLSPTLAFASQAGIVIKKQDGTTKTSCVTFDGSSISGMELLQRSGFNPVIKNGFVVTIDGEGSKNSSQMSRDDLFWSYWKFNNGWQYQNVGANYDRVVNGDIEGWEFVVGNGKCNLPTFAFKQICSSANTTASNVQVATAENSNQVQSTNNSEQIVSRDNTAVSIVSMTKTLVSKTDVSTVVSQEQLDSGPNAIVAPTSQGQASPIFPDFNLKNVSILFVIFLLIGILIVFIKLTVKKFVNSR